MKTHKIILSIQQIKYEITASRPIVLHRDLPSITLRGAFGYALAVMLSDEASLIREADKIVLFRDIFAPHDSERQHKGCADQARCFVFRGGYALLDRTKFIAELLLFGAFVDYEKLFDKAVCIMANSGLGKTKQICECRKLSSIRIEPKAPHCDMLIVDYISPTRIRADRRWWDDSIPFFALISRLLDRLQELVGLYTEEAFDVDIGHLKRRSKSIDGECLEGRRYQVNRTSGRTGDVIRLDGFIGQMLYSGDLSPFNEVLAYLPWIHVGKSAVFGCGWACLVMQNITEI